ncbi:hypothetical protein TSAR_005365 [Trichomalopsis sarcophagae]|uniref:Cytochrome P450 n=1 Tax=Trichomalopsis sarcophagae TaxID=543379 RepID=A0A232EZF3_9HYME|nr:hypothetical protein TSAR_005365 [Trichomalopsis sarcophagae]
MGISTVSRPTVSRFHGLEILPTSTPEQCCRRHVQLEPRGCTSAVSCHMFTPPQLMLSDLDLIKAVTVKNFDHFSDHKTFVDESMDPLFAGSLAMLNGDWWCEVRNVLSPAFTLSKMRPMFGLMSNCVENFVDKFLELYFNCDEVEIKEPINRYTNDVIANCDFGFDIDSLGNPDNEFYIRGRSLMSSFKNLKRAAQSDATNLGFGLGPRMCIGNRFAVLETKVMFAHLLSKCRLEPCKKTCIPLTYDPGSLAVVPKGGFLLKVLPRN